MRKTTILLITLFSITTFAFGNEGGTLTPTPNPIIPNQSVVINYDGTGTNFANWQPECFIHVWLVPKTGQSFTGNYAPAWATCNGESDYALIDSKYKMTYSGVAGKYSITIPNLFTFFSVLDEDKTKVGQFGVIVRAQYSGSNNQTIDFLLNVTDATTTFINQPETNFNISTQPGQINVQFDGLAQVELFTITGQLIRSVSAMNEFTQLVKNGAYLLRINGQTQKVMVK